MGKHDRWILTKRGGIPIPSGMTGTPIAQAWPNAKIPDGLKGALIYEIEGYGKVIAKQDQLCDGDLPPLFEVMQPTDRDEIQRLLAALFDEE